MPLPATMSITEMAEQLDGRNGRTEYFEKHAHYMEDAQTRFRYQIRVGAQTLYSEDTRDLREQFEKVVLQARRKKKPANRNPNKTFVETPARKYRPGEKN